MRGWIMNLGLVGVMSGLWMGLPAVSAPAKGIRPALQEGGTTAWQAAALEDLWFDEMTGVKLGDRTVADSKSGLVALQALPDGYRAGSVTSCSDVDSAGAKHVYALLAGFGVADPTGDKPDLAERTFWAGYRK